MDETPGGDRGGDFWRVPGSAQAACGVAGVAGRANYAEAVSSQRLSFLNAVPRPLAAGIMMALVQAGALLALTVDQLFSFSPARAELAFSNIAVFLLWALLLGACAVGLLRLNSSARAPLMAVELLHLGVAWDFWRGETVWIGVLVAVSSLVVAAGVLHPASTRAIAERSN